MWRTKIKRRRCSNQNDNMVTVSSMFVVLCLLLLVQIPVIAGLKLVSPVSKRLSVIRPSLQHRPPTSHGPTRRPTPSHDQTRLHMHQLLVSIIVGSATFFGNPSHTVAAFFETTDYNVKSTSLLERVVDTTLHSTTPQPQPQQLSTTNHRKSSYYTTILHGNKPWQSSSSHLSSKQYHLPHFSTPLTLPAHSPVHPFPLQLSELNILHTNNHQQHQHQHSKFAARTKWNALQKQIPWTTAYQKQRFHKQQHLSVVDTLKAGMPQVNMLFALAEVLDDTYEVLMNDRYDQPSDISQQSPGWEASRAKRTAAMKDLEKKGNCADLE